MKDNRQKYPTQRELKDTFVYYPSGKFVRKGRKREGKTGWVNEQGYRRMGLNNKTYYIHILIFIFHKGYRPLIVDHKNRNPLDNRIENLRPATASLNRWNSKIQKSRLNTKGVRLVHDCPKTPYAVYLSCKKQKHYLGHFSTVSLAKKARQKAELKYYGEFCK